MLWKQRMGKSFRNNYPCRFTYYQNMIQMSILAGDGIFSAESPSELSPQNAAYFPTSTYFPRRGLLISRTDLSKEAIYFHFDARPDAFFPGHDNADRGVITLSALGRTWLDDLAWSDFMRSQEHSLMHIDGQAQALKATSVRMMKVADKDGVVLAAADLTYAYNVQWSRAWQSEFEPRLDEEVFANGVAMIQNVHYTDKELGAPTAFGWPEDDPGTDIGFTPSIRLWGEPDFGFRGFFNWKRQYRTVSLKHGIRSTGLVRGKPGESYVLLGDDFAMNGAGKHRFSSHLILAQGVSITKLSWCAEDKCDIQLTDDNGRIVSVLVAADGRALSFKVDTLTAASTGVQTKRLIVTSSGMTSEQMCIAFHPHAGEVPKLKLSKDGNICTVKIGDKQKRFRFSDSNHSLELLQTGVAPSPSPSPKPAALKDPIDPVKLDYKKMRRINYGDLVHDKERFYDPSVPHSQMTFWFDVVHGSKRVLTTCRWYTNTDTVMWLYACGEISSYLAKYYERKCKLVQQGDDECWAKRAKVTHPPVSGTKAYILVVGAKGIVPGSKGKTGIGARIGLEHT